MTAPTELLGIAVSGALTLWQRLSGDIADVEIDNRTENRILEYLQEADERLREGLEKILFDGFDNRLESVGGSLDMFFDDVYQSEIRRLTDAAVATQGENAVLSQASRIVVESTLRRVEVGTPLAAALATGAGSSGAKVVSATLAKVSLKGAGKTGAKIAAKGVGVGGGAAAGVGIGMVGGPVPAAAGGVIGAVAAWFAADYAVILIDEAISREDFERELRATIAEQKVELHRDIALAIGRKRDDISGRTFQERVWD